MVLMEDKQKLGLTAARTLPAITLSVIQNITWILGWGFFFCVCVQTFSSCIQTISSVGKWCQVVVPPNYVQRCCTSIDSKCVQRKRGIKEASCFFSTSVMISVSVQSQRSVRFSFPTNTVELIAFMCKHSIVTCTVFLGSLCSQLTVLVV